jgi:hypothetical protein
MYLILIALPASALTLTASALAAVLFLRAPSKEAHRFLQNAAGSSLLFATVILSWFAYARFL